MSFDPQAKAVFRVEAVLMSDLISDVPLQTLEQAQAFLLKMTSEGQVKSALPGGRAPKLAVDSSRQFDQTRGQSICLGREASMWSLTHELAHAMTSPLAEAHGKAFCGNLLRATRAGWGEAVARRLQALLDQHEATYPANAAIPVPLAKAA